MKIAICGVGFSGSYLARRLVTEGVAKPSDIRLFEHEHRIRRKFEFVEDSSRPCASPCAFGIHRPTLIEAIERTNIGEPDEFILQEFDHIVIGDTKPKADLCTFNKPLFELMCVSGMTFSRSFLKFEDYDVIVDATAKRALIGKIFSETLKEPLWIHTRQIRLDIKSPNIKITRLKDGGVGYEWVFPLGDLGTHVGYGKIGEAEDKYESERKICACGGRIRLSAPKYSFPLYTRLHNGDGAMLITVGESAGMISSITGGGNKEAIDGIEILLKYWDDFPTAYDKIVEEFRWAEREFNIVSKLHEGKGLSLTDLKTIAKNAKRYDIKVGVKEAIVLVKNIIGDKFVRLM